MNINFSQMKSFRPLFHIFFLSVLGAAFILLQSCGRGRSLLPGDVWQIRLNEQGPLALQLTQKASGRTVAFSAAGHPAFYYITDAGTQYPEKQKQVLTGNDSVYSVSFTTTDRREATVTLTRGKKGILDIQFTVQPSAGILHTGMTIEAGPDEHYYGLMERTVDGDQNLSWQKDTPASLDLRGKKVTMLVRSTLGIYEPFYASSAGYGLFVHGIRPGYYDLAATDTGRIDVRFDDAQLTFSVLPGPTLPEVVKRLPALTGSSFLPPKWAFRPLRWRDDHTNRKKYYNGTRVRAPYNSELVEDILMARAYDIPIGAYWVDRPWAAGYHGYGDLRWDPERFPQAQQMIDWINHRGMKFLVWIAPWACDSMLQEATAKNYLMPLPAHKKPIDHWIINYYDPAAMAWWEKILQQRLISMGIAGFKMDRSEELITRIDTCVLPDGRKVHNLRNDYPRLYIKAAHDALQEKRGDDFLPMPRAGYTGSQQYGVFWGGDISAGPYGLRTALIAVQRCAFMNFPLWGSDIGGYWKHPLSHINVARWLAFGAFTPIMEVGPLDNRAPWDMPYKPHYDTSLIAVYRTYSIIHDAMKDYSYAMARKASQEGIPIVRPLALAFPEDQQAAAHWDEYMYGDNILVGIIWKNDQFSFDMYLPEGRWTDYWTGKEYQGGQTVHLDCPEYKIPIFLTGENRPALPDPNKLYRESLQKAAKKPDLDRLQREEFGVR